MDDYSAPRSTPAVLTEIPRQTTPMAPRAVVTLPPRIPPANALLFLLTLATTTTAGAYMAGAPLFTESPYETLAQLYKGFAFSIPMMAILLAHEMGHYTLARRNGVDVTLPYFIPAPFPSLFIIGTFGAFIRMKSQPRTRRVMFDVGAAGPWFGFFVAVPCVIAGLMLSEVRPLDQSMGGLQLGDSILFWSLSRWILGVDPNQWSVLLHPVAFAGWVGLFVTTLNLLPVGQLDGGHVTYALFGGRLHRLISRALILGCVALALVPALLGRDFWGGWMLWAVILIALGIGHPATIDAATPLDPRRRAAAWLTVFLFIATFTPVPISFVPPTERMREQPGEYYDVRHDTPTLPAAIGNPTALDARARVETTA